MSPASLLSASNPSVAQRRLVVLGQWVRAGLALARGARAGRGLVGGAVALWRVLQAVRLAMHLVRRLSELSEALAFAATQSGTEQTPAWTRPACDPPGDADFLRHALAEIAGSIRDALGRAPDRRRSPDPRSAARVSMLSEVARALGRPTPARRRPPDRLPRPEPRPARRRSACPAGASRPALTPSAALADGRFRLAAG